jgi:hypothetical protein
MTRNEKAAIYEDCIRESDRLQRENSKLKSEHAGNIPPQVHQQISENDKKIAHLVVVLENLFRDE